MRTQDTTIDIDFTGMTEAPLPVVAPAPPPPRMRLWPLRWQRHSGRTSIRWSAESLTRHYLVLAIPGSGAVLRVLTNPGRDLIGHLGGSYRDTDAAVDAAVALHEAEGA